MPKEIYNELEKAADKKGLKGKKRDSYVYGSMAKLEKMLTDWQGGEQPSSIRSPRPS